MKIIFYKLLYNIDNSYCKVIKIKFCGRKYDVQIEQILQYNPLIKKIGLKKSFLI